MLHPDKLPRSEFVWSGLALQLGKRRVLTLVADATYPHLYRISYPDGWISSPANLSRAKDAAFGHARYLLGTERRLEGRYSPRKDGGLMEDPQDSFSSARHLLLEVMAEQEGCSLLDAVRTYNRNEEFKRRIDITVMNMTAAGLVLDSLAIQAAFKLGVQGIGFH